MTRSKATAIGFSAVLMWGLLALFTIGSAPVPPLQLNAMCFSIGGLIGLVWTARTGFGVLRGVSWKIYLFGTLGLFGAHLLYFTAFRLAPSAETGLIAYLWPLLIVLMSGLLPAERLGPLHIGGALCAFAGAALIVLSGGQSGTGGLAGYAVALMFAVWWASYSVLSRLSGSVPTEAVTVFCVATAILSLAAHLLLETTVWPSNAMGWAAIIGLGVGPVGIAFFTWDVGMKRGDIQLLGVASYAAPLLSTVALVAAGYADPTPTLAVAAVLITAGAALAARASAGKAV